MRRLGNWLAAGLLAVSAVAGEPATGNPEAEAGFVSLFNGKDLTNWSGLYGFWSVEDGAITGRTTKERPAPGNTFLIWKGGYVPDFVLRLSYRVTPNNDAGFANSGVQYRSRSIGYTNFAMAGYQADIEAGPTFAGILYDEAAGAGGRGVLAERGEVVVWEADGTKRVVGSLGKAEELGKAIKKDDWNDYEISCQGYHFIHKINGVTMVDVTDKAEKRIATGALGLQLHAGQPMIAQFKDIRLKRITPERKLVLIAGPPSHGPGDHEHRAGCLLLKKCLDQVAGLRTVVVTNGWPADLKVFEDADAVAVYSDGGGGHPLLQGDRLRVIGDLMKKGVGLGCIHYAVEVPKEKGGLEFLAWIAGYFETFYSVNPTWEADFKYLPRHLITRGVQPFKIRDEWYYHMRFLGSGSLMYILSAVPPDETRGKPGANDPHGGNPDVQQYKNTPEHVMWAVQRPDGGRGFGFTGGHYHKNWGDDNFRRLILNALAWIAKVEVPLEGIGSTVTEEDLKANLDPKGK